MKRGALDHPKMMMLELRLEQIYKDHHKRHQGSFRAMAIGIVEIMLEWASKYAIQGDIGKWPNEVIARGIGWELDGNDLITSLIESRWLDKVDGPQRLVVHDIKDHATNAWRQNLEDAGLTWWDGSPPRKYKLQKYSRNTPEDSRKSPQPKPKPYPEPEPEPEPIPETPNGSTPGDLASPTGTGGFRAGAAADDAFPEFLQAYAETGAPTTEADWADARIRWRTLDFEQKLQAVHGVRKRLELGVWTDPAMIPRPQNYLRPKGEFTREVIAPRPRAPCKLESQMERVKAKLRKEMDIE